LLSFLNSFTFPYSWEVPNSKNKKAIRFPLWLLKIKKPWGQFGHPWLSNPLSGLDLWVTPLKIKEIEVKNLVHASSSKAILTTLVLNCQEEFDPVGSSRLILNG